MGSDWVICPSLKQTSWLSGPMKQRVESWGSQMGGVFLPGNLGCRLQMRGRVGVRSTNARHGYKRETDKCGGNAL